MDNLVSIVIPTRNEEIALSKILSSLKKQTYKNYEVVVVDGGSKDKTREIALKNKAKFVPETGKNHSPANARNIGLEEAKGEIILVADCDYEFDADFLERGVAAFGDKKTQVVTCPQTLIADTWVEKILVAKINVKNPLRNVEFVWPLFSRKGFLSSLGGWDNTLGSHDDVDLSKRIVAYDKSHGCKSIGRSSSAVKIHLPQTVKELWGQQKWYGRTIMTYLKKEGGLKNWVVLVKVGYAFVPLALIAAAVLPDYSFWLLLCCAPFLILTLLRTLEALLKGRLWGIGFIITDIIMGAAFGRGLIQYAMKKRKTGRD